MSQHDPNLPQNEKGSSMVKSAIKSILITALVLLSLVAAFFVVGKIITMTQREPSEPGLFERDANNGDVEVNVGLGLLNFGVALCLPYPSLQLLAL